MGCINDKSLQKKQSRKQQYQSKFQNSKNPIIRIAKQWNVDIIKQRWHDNELDILRQKLGPNVNRISRDKFMTLLPSLKHFSDITINNLYDLFNFQQQQELNIDDFLIAQIIILKSDDYELLADMFLFVYSSDESKRLLSQNDFQLFQKQFKQYQLEFLHETKRPVKNQVGQVIINRKDFREIFEQYDMKTIKILFRFDMKDEQRKFQKHLSVQGINRNSQEQTFLVDFEWFLKWKNYLQYKYGIKIEIKQNGKSLSRQKNNLFLNTLKDHQSIIQAGQRLANSQNQNYLQPVNNDRIQGQDQNELRENLIQLQDFISVPADVWKQIRILYGGGPQITKPYPNFYNKKIVLTIFDEKKCSFQVGFAKGLIYIPTQSFETIYKKRQQRYFLKQPVENVIAYYKHPGEWEWKKIQNLQISLQELPFKFKVFIVFVPKKSTQQFESSFNITEPKGKKQIKERIKNFGNLLSFQYEGLLQQGHVGNILQNSVLIYLKNQRGQYYRIQKTFKELQKLNSNTLEDQFLQGFAGLENIGNSCYINSPLQCLLKTPYFEEYLDSVNLDKTRKDMLTYQLHEIYDQCKKSRDCVSMSSFKKVFDEKFPFFQGSSQQDAQQFLLLLLDKLSQQQPRQSLMGIDLQTKKNRKIHSFFSGKTKAQTACVKCHKKGIVEQSFFTYSLSLPIINESLFSFYFIDENFKIFKHSLTINRESEIGEVIKEIENQLGIDHKHLYIMSAFQNEWMNNLNNLHSAYKIAKLENYDARVICYKIKKFQNPDQEDIAQQKDDKSVKIQIRNRCYNPKTKSYRSFHYPFYIEVDSQLTGQQLRQTVTKKIKRFINNEQYQSFKSIQGDKNAIAQKPFETSGLQKKSNKQQLNQERQPQQMQKKSKHQQSLPFVIQYLKSEDNNKSTCWFCKKKVDSFSKQHKQKTDCEGCQFPDDQRIWKNKIFMKNYQKLVITIDWESITFSKNWAIQETKSCAQAQKLQKSRRSNLQNLLIEAYELQQSIQLKCQNTNCRSDLAIRKQRIIQAPNILILHLKRFFYKDNMFHKLKNKVDIPETFVLPGFSEKYELYGNVVHYGSGTGRGGHYINYVNVSGRWYRCDDEKVHFTKQPNEHLNPDTYLLFYRRKAMDRSWSFFGF